MVMTAPRRKLLSRCIAPTLALSLLVGACGDADDTAAKYTERGIELYEEGNLAKAQIEFRNALQADPKAVEPRYYMAQIQERQGNFASAFGILQGVAADQPDHVAAQAKLGQFYFAQREIDKARQRFSAAAKLDPDHPEVLLLQATLAFGEEDYRAAAAGAAAAIAADPENVGAAMLQARSLREIGRIEEALTVLDDAIERNAEKGTLRLFKVQMLLADGRTDEAITVYRDLVAAEPEVYEHRRLLVALYLQGDQAAEAEAALRQAIADNVGGNQPKLQLSALVNRERGRDAAIAELLSLIEAEPDELVLRLRLAGLYLDGDNKDMGEDILEQIIQEDPDGPSGTAARVRLARYHIVRNDRANAEAQLTEVLNRDPNNADALTLRAYVSIETGDPSAAITDMRTVLRGRPASKSAWEMLERAYREAGQSELAEETLARIAELDPRDPQPLQRLAIMKAQRGQTDEALVLLDEVLEKDPVEGSQTLATSLQAKATLLISQRKWEEAEAVLTELGEIPQWKTRALVLTGILNVARQDFDKAVSSFEEAHTASPDSAEPVRALVQLQLRRGHAAEAAAFLEQVVASRPDNPVFVNLLGEVQMLSNKLDAAQQSFETARSLRPSWAMPYMNLAIMRSREGEHLEALAVVDSGLKEAPGSPLLLNLRGEIQDRLGRHADAIATFLSVVDSDPTNIRAANNAAALIADHAFEDPALLERAVELIKVLEGQEAPAFLDTRGWVLYRTGDYEQARTLLEEAAAQLPDIAQVSYHYGMVLARLGETAKAREVLARAVDGTPQYPGLNEARATLDRLGS